MNIAVMVRGYITAPQPKDIIYAPIELAIDICEQLTKRGHGVTYFGPMGSHMQAKVETLNLPPLVHNQQEMSSVMEGEPMRHYYTAIQESQYALEMFQRAKAGEFDLLYFHHPEVALPYAKLFPEVPVVYTLHDPISDWYKDMFALGGSPNQHFVSISNSQRRPAPDLPYAATVYNGINIEQFTFEAEPDDYLLFTGRMVAEKGIKEAVEVAQQTDSRLLMIGPVYDDNREAFDCCVKPYLNERILHLGFIERADIARYYQKAKAFLAPMQWEEPFGLTLVEAMACGTPVLAMNRGSVPEVIVDGKTGFVVNTLADMVEAVDKLDTINRQDCRDHAVSKFATKQMVDGYEAVFTKILAKT